MCKRDRKKQWVRLPALVLALGIAMPIAHAGETADIFSDVDRFHAPEMKRMRAGDGDVTTNVAGSQDFRASSSDNSFTADAITNGAVSVTGEALKNFSGIANVVFTTGNSNSVNAAINVILVLGQ